MLPKFCGHLKYGAIDEFSSPVSGSLAAEICFHSDTRSFLRFSGDVAQQGLVQSVPEVHRGNKAQPSAGQSGLIIPNGENRLFVDMWATDAQMKCSFILIVSGLSTYFWPYGIFRASRRGHSIKIQGEK